MFSKKQTIKIKFYLNELGLTQQYLAHHFHYTRQHINKIVNGRVENLKMQEKLIEFFESRGIKL